MTETYQIVPWYNSEEWHKVHRGLSDTTSDKHEVLSTLLIWKARCPSLPSGIESTLNLLQILVQDVSKETEDVGNDQLLRLAYSSAIMRFVNHMLDTETAKGTSLYKAAKNLGVPDWIVDLRHDTAHSNKLPSITLLREACDISLQWLRKNFWDKHKKYIRDYLTAPTETKSIDESKVAALVNFAMTLSICAHSNCKIKKLSGIPDRDMKKSILHDAIELFGNDIDLSNPKTVTIKSLINISMAQFKMVLKDRDVATVCAVLLGDDTLFLSKELLHHFGSKDFRQKRKLRNDYVQCFEVLLTMLHTNELLLEFMLSLVRITQCGENDNFKARLAALWLSEILIALKKSKCFTQKLKKMDYADIQSKKKNDLRQLYYHWFPNDSAHHLILDLTSPVPSELTDIQFIQPIISTYNPYLHYFVKDLLNLVEPTLAKTVTQKICKLAELISAPENFSISLSSKIYTADDLKASDDSHDTSIHIVENIESMDVLCSENEQENVNSGNWKLAAAEHSWSTCPIGVLPWQSCVDTVTEMET